MDEHRSAHLDDVGAPGYDAVVVVTTSGEERLALARRDAINCAGRQYWACRLASGRPARADRPAAQALRPDLWTHRHLVGPAVPGARPDVRRCPAPVTPPSSRSGVSRYDHHH